MRFRSCAGVGGLFVLVSLLSTTAGCGTEDSAAAGDGGLDDGGVDLDAGMDSGRDAAPPDGATDMDAGQDASPPEDAAQDAMPDAQDDAGDAMMPPANMLPMHLSETGLYAEGSLSELAEGVMPYAPRYELWSDGADKLRWLLLPEGTTIDTSDIDAFVFPVGTKAWKEFSRDGKKLETRLLWKTSTGWLQVAYAWNEAQDDAVSVPRGADDVLGTTHDIPQRIDCRECHGGSADTLLGVSAVQLAHGGAGLTLAQLEADGWLSDAPPADFAPPDELAWNALGYLHANCATCHNPLGIGYDRVDLDVGLRVAELADITTTQTYLTAVDQPVEQTDSDDTARVEPGFPEDSALVTRMKLRGDVAGLAMPPLASEITDDAGIALVEDWIESIGPN